MPTDPNALHRLRRDYTRDGLTEETADRDPFLMLQRWLDEAIAAELDEPNAMVVATVDEEGAPHARVVLLKGLDRRGLVFFTNYESDKGRQLAANPRAEAVFYWGPLERQVRVAGHATKVDRAETERYFASRPRDAQIGAWASDQSRPVASREALEAEWLARRAAFGDGPVPAPPHWGGVRIAPEWFEFWQGRPSRMHDRLRYLRDGDEWRIVRLNP